MKVIEQSIFLRPFNYLRVRHDYSVRFNLVVPMVLAAILCSIILGFSHDPNLFRDDGLIDGFTQLLGILAPFYVASLAAVATFGANKLFDEKFAMAEALTIERLESGQWKTRDLTVRQFLSLLFGYCAVISLVLFLFSLIGPVIAPGVAQFVGPSAQVFGRLIFVCYMFVLAHMLTATIIGIYYLCDRMHR